MMLMAQNARATEKSRRKDLPSGRGPTSITRTGAATTHTYTRIQGSQPLPREIFVRITVFYSPAPKGWTDVVADHHAKIGA